MCVRACVCVRVCVYRERGVGCVSVFVCVCFVCACVRVCVYRERGVGCVCVYVCVCVCREREIERDIVIIA